MITISNSEIQLYKSCKRSWYVQNYLGRQPKQSPAASPVNLGTKIHACLEAYYSPDIKATPSHALTMLRYMYEMDIADNPMAAEELWKEHELGGAMLLGYFQWIAETGADQWLNIIAVEREIVVPLTSEISLRGKLDMIVEDKHSGAKLFMDHKTCIQFLTTDYLDRDEQSKFYMMLQRLSKQDEELWCDGGVFNMLRKTKRTGKAVPPFYKREIIRHNTDSLNSMYLRTFEVANEILALRKDLDGGVKHQQVAYPHPTKDCAWKCPLASGPCSMLDDGSDWQGYVNNVWHEIDPYARYVEESYLDRLDQEGKL